MNQRASVLIEQVSKFFHKNSGFAILSDRYPSSPAKTADFRFYPRVSEFPRKTAGFRSYRTGIQAPPQKPASFRSSSTGIQVPPAKTSELPFFLNGYPSSIAMNQRASVFLQRVCKLHRNEPASFSSFSTGIQVPSQRTSELLFFFNRYPNSIATSQRACSSLTGIQVPSQRTSGLLFLLNRYPSSPA